MTTNVNRDFKGVWIPKEIYLNQDLSWSEKILLIEIHSLENEEGCFASNEYLASFLMCSVKTIEAMLTKLRKLELIFTKKFDGRNRFLGTNIRGQGSEKVGDSNLKKEGSDSLKSRGQGSEKVGDYIYNNIDIKNNNTIINKKKNEKKDFENLIDNDLRFSEEDKKQIKIFLLDRKERKKPITERGLSILLNELKDLIDRGYNVKHCIDRAIQSNWTGIKSEWFKDNNSTQKNTTQPVDYNFSGKNFINSIAEDNI